MRSPQSSCAHRATSTPSPDEVPADRAGTASAVLNTGRQAGGAIAVEVFGALPAGRTRS
ncbi:hypothetical protein T261_8238 [Streptomyces lydicus]|nr:hypothetical protein T261_8238 [Streptomyces lydicus]